MKTYFVDAAPAVARKAWRDFHATLSVPGDKPREARLEPVEGEPDRTRLSLAVDDERDAAQADAEVRRFRDFLDELVLGGAKGIPSLADPAVPRKR